ncbi:MAG TPA: hypothetical protein DCE42_22355 [Myxococcales bacterium]|nr:hypothetical protein [Myxococcales bacterium]
MEWMSLLRAVCLLVCCSLFPTYIWAASTPKAAKLPRIKGKPSKRKRKKKKPNRLEFTILPVLNYSTDRGLGFGVYSIIAKFKEGVYPYLWRAYFRLSSTVKLTENGEALFPFHEDFVRLDLPGLDGGRVRLNLRAGFFRFSTTGYYGIGNASQRLIGNGISPELVKPSSYYQIDRIYPEVMLLSRRELWRKGRKRLSSFFGANVVYNVTNFAKGSRLDEDIKAAERGASAHDLFLRDMLRGLRPHARFEAHLGLVYDSRDSEFAPSKGMFHEVSVRGGTAFSSELSYSGLNAKARFFFSIWKDYLVFAVRLIGDVLFGNTPYYELYRYGGLFPDEGPGGGYNIRGTSPQRFYGRGKLIGNAELRSKIFAFDTPVGYIALGLVLFADAGRVWGALSYQDKEVGRIVDGEGAGLQYGFGVGGRLQLGATVVMRADVAYSPSENGNIGFFFLLGHVF